MKKYLLAGLCFLATSNVSADQLSWAQLLPVNVPTIEDPFAELTDEQRFKLISLAKYRLSENLNEDQRQTMEDIKQRLEFDGLDIEWLFAKSKEIANYRRKLSSMPNEALNEDNYEIPGFITPVEFSDDVITKFFLVPTAGACIHTPPPPANQIVLVHYPKGIKFNLLNEPVWVKGDLKIQKTKADVTYSDGAADVETIYQMNNVSVRPYR
ncbi:hypothetical protein ACOMICROBIO_FLGHMIGD_04222 [Vibrio sp. B1FLJ16]|uniref:DUF3299 domain-containing protein n=1 Tax=Vibrio sp. B1FLJ16 TaxID=2751178 RepID=UPI0015F5ECE6|nr:DUF3299 domain-containing protein [Vibrio sp. B1FLJ16]CAD7820690.1 hypothetical protein ACOMICROBIO_FLGHMIGD_04222 [Vibrio sp. B1FLJ16]CAE6943884.1 hypothetical protein ACOMICROBIO_FLGHMIGD_04222 [Vibrio sp. B1FLJ16]